MAAVRLRPEITASRAISTLRQLAQDAENKHSWVGSGEEGVRLGRDQYLSWAESAEPQLRNLLAEPNLIETLHSDRYWRIRELNGRTPRPHALVGAEIDTQVAALRATADRLESFARLAGRAGTVLVLDTNVFLQCKLFTTLDWLAELEASVVRLVVPLLVLDELDDKTFSANKRLNKRADKVLRAFDRFMDDMADNNAAEITPGVTLEVLLDEDDHLRRANSDTELLDRAEFLHQVIERPVTIVTTDRGMRVRGKARGLQVRAMPDHLRLPPGGDDDTDA